MHHFSAIGAAGVVMDVHTGEVLAMTSLPTFNPNAPGQGTPDQMFNRATLGVFELGSTFKPFTLAMAMDSRRSCRVPARYSIARRRSPPTAISSTTPIRSAANARSPRS